MRMQRELKGLRQAGCLPKNMYYSKAEVQIYGDRLIKVD